jgi:hypothetical protein
VRYQVPSFGIWTKMNAPFLCIEPWFGYSDSIESTGNFMEKEGIQIIEADQIFGQNLVLKSSNSLNRTIFVIFYPFPNLETERLILRRVDKDDP